MRLFLAVVLIANVGVLAFRDASIRRLSNFVTTRKNIAKHSTITALSSNAASPCVIKVVGVGGGGGNAVNRMIETSNPDGVEMWVVNTDAQALARSIAPNKLNIGSKTSR